MSQAKRLWDCFPNFSPVPEVVSGYSELSLLVLLAALDNAEKLSSRGVIIVCLK